MGAGQSGAAVTRQRPDVHSGVLQRGVVVRCGLVIGVRSGRFGSRGSLVTVRDGEFGSGRRLVSRVFIKDGVELEERDVVDPEEIAQGLINLGGTNSRKTTPSSSEKRRAASTTV